MNDETTVVEINIRPMTLPEQMYCYQQSDQISGMTGLIGHLRADMGMDGDNFFSSFWYFQENLKTQEFKEELDAVIDALRNDHLCDGILGSRNGMAAYCRKHSESKMKNDERSHGVRVDTEKRAYLLRLNPHAGEYNLYCYCYIKKWLDRHLEKAKQGIRFITPEYKEIFRIQDGDRIRITQKDGTQQDRACRFIDETHMELQSGFGSSLYHICEFAEIVRRNDGMSVVPLRASLPEMCYSVLQENGQIVVLKRGDVGYFQADIPSSDLESANALVALYNQKLGVTKPQFEAMKAGSMFGFQVPAADPQNYDDQGQPRVAGRN